MRRSQNLLLVAEGGTREADFPVSLVQPQMKKESDLSTLNAADLFAILEGNGPTVTEEEDVPVSPPGDNLLLGDEGSQFLEGFTNLSDYLFAGGSTPLDLKNSKTPPFPPVANVVATPVLDTVELFDIPMELETTQEPEVTSTQQEEEEEEENPLKRTIEEVFELVALNTDHDDYVAKRARRDTCASTSSESGKTGTRTKAEKYRERRDKNNVASKRSRQIRKEKFQAMECRALELEAANLALEKKAEELERLTAKMKEILVKRLSQTN